MESHRAVAGFKTGQRRSMLALDCRFDRILRRWPLRHGEGEGTVAFGRGNGRLPRRRSCADYPIRSIEDGMAEDDFDGLEVALDRGKVGGKVQLVGDDLFVTNPKRLCPGNRRRAPPIRCWSRSTRSASLTETLDRRARWPSARSYTCRHVAPFRRDRGCDHRRPRRRHQLRPDQDRFSLARSDRLAKYNQLIRIEEELGPSAAYAGMSVLRG